MPAWSPMPYFWSRVTQPGKLPFNMLVRAEDAEQAHTIALSQSLAAGEVEAAADHSVCQACSFQEHCFAANWEGAYTKADNTPDENGRSRAVATDADKDPTYVHTCPVCLDTWMGSQEGASDQVPDDCPRRDPQRDTLVCNPCQGVRRGIQRSHPRYEALVEATHAYEKAHTEDPMEVTDLAPGVVDFGQRHKQVESERALARASEPFSYVTSPEQFDRPMGVLALWLLLALWECLPEDLSAFMGMHADQVAMAKREWLEELYLALLRHRESTFAVAADEITTEWIMGFTDQGNLSLGWMAMPLHQRRDLRDAWVKATETTLTEQLHAVQPMPPATIQRLFNEA